MPPQELLKLQAEVNDLVERWNSLKAFTTIPYDVGEAMKERILRDQVYPFIATNAISESNKSASSENQAVNEGGVATYNVLKPPDGFDERTDADGNTKYYPFYT